MMTNEEIADRLFERVESMIGKALAPVLDRLGELEVVEVPTAADVAKTILAGEEMAALVDLHVSEAVAQIEPIKGDPGRDADPVAVAEVLARSGELSATLSQMTSEAVSKHMEAHPVRDGKDATAEDVEKSVAEYLKANPPQPGKDGADGIGLAGALIGREGDLIVTLTNGEAKSLGPVVGRDGVDGKHGKDGAGLVDLVRSYDEKTHEIVEVWGEKELRYPAGGIRPGGYWREGTKAVAAQVWNHAGVAWIAKRDTTAKPTRESPDWEIFANRGRDGADGKVVKAPEPVKLGSGNA